MQASLRLRWIAPLPLLLLPACGGSGSPPAPEPPGFSLAVAPSGLSLAQGASGALTVTATRTGGHSGAIALSVDALPAGVTASGSIASGAASGGLTVTVASAVAPRSYGSLTLHGVSGTLDRTATFTLTVTGPSAGLPADQVQASGAPQTGAGGLANAPVAGEPAQSRTAAAGTTTDRNGFIPSGQ